MPIPFSDSGDNAINPQSSIAWLRFVVGEGGEVRAALFLTTPDGEPLAFCFARAGNRSQSALGALAKSLFQAAPAEPAILLGLADEAPPRVFASDPKIEMPFCRLVPADAAGRFPQSLWETEPPSDSSQARRILDNALKRDDPLEPFNRAANCLDEAFSDLRISSAANIDGLSTVVTLSNPLRASASPRQDSQPTLAERLWATLAAPKPVSLDVNLQWAADLMPFQQEGVSAMLDMKRILLADDMGLGKTIQAIAAARILIARREIGSCLVVAPASLLDQWRREITKWAPELSAIIIRGAASDRRWQWAASRDITIVSYDTLRADFGRRRPPTTRNWDVVIADEAQRAKNRNDTSVTLKRMPRTRSWALTGTPIENDEEELASIMEFVDHDPDAPPRRYHPGAALLERHRQLQLRRRKSDVLDDLPEKQETKLTIELRPRQRASYDRAERDGVIYLRSLGSEVRVQHILELITRLKQICNVDPETGESSKLEDIRDRLEQLTARGHKALVFSQYTNDVSGVAAVANRLREFSPITLTGETPMQDRAAVIDRFKTSNRHKALIMSLRAGGLGLNLQEASYVFHLDRWWNPAIERQAEDRTHRMGQTVKVNVIKYSCVGTIEQRIDEILERKQELFDRLIDDVSLDLSARLSRDELLGLFGLG